MANGPGLPNRAVGWLRGAVGGAALAILLLGCAARQASATAPAPLDIRSVMPAYWAAALHNAASGAERVRSLKAEVLRRFPDLYGPFISIPSDADLAEYLTNVAPLASEMRALEPALMDEIRFAGGMLGRRFGPLDTTVYVAPSLFTSNGQVRWLGGRPVIMFGLDVQAYVETEMFQGSPGRDLRQYVIHEFFHAYHYAANADIARAAEQLFANDASSPLYLNLWIEGLATCASRRLAGGSIERSLSMPRLHREVAPHVRLIAGELRARLDSTSTDDRRDYFWLQSGRNDIPARSAYALGMLAADRVLERLTIEAAMQLRSAEIRSALERALDDLAGGSFDGNWNEVCAGES